jgi:hypothetical protein
MTRCGSILDGHDVLDTAPKPSKQRVRRKGKQLAQATGTGSQCVPRPVEETGSVCGSEDLKVEDMETSVIGRSKDGTHALALNVPKKEG